MKNILREYEAHLFHTPFLFPLEIVNGFIYEIEKWFHCFENTGCLFKPIRVG